jgi:uncharacterized membrane protein
MPQTLADIPAYQSLLRRIERLESRTTQTGAVASTASQKRFRIAATQTAILLGAGASTSVSVVWSTPMPTDTYKVDVAVSALLGQPVSNIQVTSQTAAGCTVSFTVPALLALGTAVTLLAVSSPN